MRQPRLLFYAVNGLGLGHVTRLLSIARRVRELAPDAEILFLTASEAAHVIYREGFAALKVPSRAAANTGRLRHGSFVRLTQSVVWNAVTAFDPHCLVVDTFAAGALHELLPLLRWPLRKVFVFRVQRPERASDTFLQNTLRLYDLVLIPHVAGSEEVLVPDGVERVWAGPMLLRDPSEMLERGDARTALGLPPQGEIGLITLGGGGDPETLAAREQLYRAIAATGKAMLWVEMDGPLSRGTATERSTTGAINHRVLRDVYPLMPYLNAFDCAVVAVGYNTTHELQAARVPTILWPFARDVDDQGQRARRLAQAGRAMCVSEGTGSATGSGSECVSSRSDATGEDRIVELTAAIRDIIQPTTQDRLRQAMTTGFYGPNAAPDTWRNGALIGAEAILKLLAH